MTTWVLLLLAGLFGNLFHRDAFDSLAQEYLSLPLAFNMQVLVYLNPETAVMFRVLTLGAAVGDWVYFESTVQRDSLDYDYHHRCGDVRSK